jgi:hypothetical protein
VSIHADDEFSLRIALEGELDNVLPADGLAGVVIARYRRTRRRRVAGAVTLVVVAAGIGVPLGLAGPSGKPAHPSAPDRAGSVTHSRDGAAPAPGLRAPTGQLITSTTLSPASLVLPAAA